MQGITVDLSTLKAEWESRSAAAGGGGGSSSLNGGFLNNNNDNSSISGSGIDLNEEIDVVGGLDSCSESESERVDSAADGSIDGESSSYQPRVQDPNQELLARRKPSLSHLNHQPGIHHWGLSLLERRRELVGLSQPTSSGSDEVQSSSIDLSVKGREERRRLNPFSIDSLLGNNNRCVSPHHLMQPVAFKSPAASPASSANSSLPTSPTLT